MRLGTIGYEILRQRRWRCWLPFLMIAALMAGGAGCGYNRAASTPSLVIEPDDGRGPILDAIGSAKNNIRLTIYEITDLASVPQSPMAPAESVVQALIDKARSGVNVRVIVDQEQYGGSSATDLEMQQTVQALRNAGAIVHLSSTAFCFTHEKTFVIDGPMNSYPGILGRAMIMSLNMMPTYFGQTRDYAVITSDYGVVKEVSRVFDSDFELINPAAACSYAHGPATTYAPPGTSDTPVLSESSLLWSPVNSKPKLLQLIGSAKQSLVITTEEMTDADMVCQIEAVAKSASKPSVRILVSGDNGSNAAGVKTLLDLGLPNLSIRVMPGLGVGSYQTPLYMHGKQVIADSAEAFVGSENLTNTSLIQNRELGTLFTDPAMIARLQAAFTSDFTTAGSSIQASACTGGNECSTIACPAQ